MRRTNLMNWLICTRKWHLLLTRADMEEDFRFNVRRKKEDERVEINRPYYAPPLYVAKDG